MKNSFFSPQHWLGKARAALPSREVILSSPLLRPLAHRISHPKLWHLQRESVARGVAVGLFWAFAFPVAQVLLAAAHCAWCRGNIPVAAGVTLVTNPITFGFWLWLAYQLGAAVMGVTSATSVEGASGWLATVGGPTVLGMGMFALIGAALGYWTVKWMWMLHVQSKRRKRCSSAAVRMGM